MCYRKRPVNPFKFIADELYKREEIPLPDEDGESSAAQRIIELETEVTYYKNLVHSLNRAKGNPIEIKKENILTSTKSIHLDNGVKIKLPDLNALAIVNGTQSSGSDEKSNSVSNESLKKEYQENGPLLSEDSNSTEEEDEKPVKKRSESDSESSKSSNQNTQSNRSNTEQTKNDKVSNGLLSGSDTEVDESENSDSSMNEDPAPEFQPKENQNTEIDLKISDTEAALSPKNTQQRIDDDIDSFFKSLDSSEVQSQVREPSPDVETLDDVISALTENPAKISPIADSGQIKLDGNESSDSSAEPQEKKMKLDDLDNSEGSENLGIFEYPVISVDTKILEFSGIFQYPEFPDTSKNPATSEIPGNLDSSEIPGNPEIPECEARTTDPDDSVELGIAEEEENCQQTSQNLDKATVAEKPAENEEPETSQVKSPAKKTIVEREFWNMDDELELDYEYDDL